MTTPVLYGLYACLVVLAGGIFMALPAERTGPRRPHVAGLVLAAGGAVGVGLHVVRWLGAGFEGRVFFGIFAVMAIVAAVRVVTHRRPVYSAVYFVLVMLAVTGLCILAAAEFLAAALVIVYGGAILVTYIFVIMLAQQAGEAPYDAQAREPLAAVLLGFALLATVTQAMVATDPIARHAAQARRGVSRPGSVQPAASIGSGPDAGTVHPAAASGEAGNVRQIGRVLAGDHMIAVQVAGILMLVAMVGAIAIARKKIEPASRTPFEESQLEQAPRPVGRTVEPFAEVRQHEHG
ncbi:MAG: NADH-quinone oxidoreductase subunit J [Planctomycetes bacterium]|nr:NADH-quinone oxidoreductase subunit J [Planctomycetota bacterium]